MLQNSNFLTLLFSLAFETGLSAGMVTHVWYSRLKKWRQTHKYTQSIDHWPPNTLSLYQNAVYTKCPWRHAVTATVSRESSDQYWRIAQFTLLHSATKKATSWIIIIKEKKKHKRKKIITRAGCFALPSKLTECFGSPSPARAHTINKCGKSRR